MEPWEGASKKYCYKIAVPKLIEASGVVEKKVTLTSSQWVVFFFLREVSVDREIWYAYQEPKVSAKLSQKHI